MRRVTQIRQLDQSQATGPSRTVLTLIVYSLAEGSGWVYICV